MTFNRNNTNQQDYQPEFSEKVVDIKRVAKVVKGGRNLSFRTLVVIGNGKGKVGVGLGKSEAIPDAVQKATSVAQKNLVSFDLKETTIPYQVEAKYGAAQVIIKPAPQGTGIRAGASMRAVLEQSGVKDVVAKSLRSQNPINVVRATISALGQLSEKNSGAEEVQDGGSEDVQN
ncbi:MAG: 30S ribosomal protein S5 [SAR202 cluster bacterium]|nr:30S ribosomal protein S5 [SAR202 cluster bacterium]|tara:strand:+ start:371 stop:892 length:522 start_codon:yes stop_codon:yes gene_type:complete